MKIWEILQSWLKIGYKHYTKHLSQYILIDPRILIQGAQALLSVYHPHKFLLKEEHQIICHSGDDGNCNSITVDKRASN